MNLRLKGDFNGLFATEGGGTLLCLSHGDSAVDDKGNATELSDGMHATAFDPDTDDQGNPANLIANGVVMPSPHWLQCNGSKWALKVDERGCYHESEEPGK